MAAAKDDGTPTTELTIESMKRLLTVLQQAGQLRATDRVQMLGSGRGPNLLHFMANGVNLCVGMEANGTLHSISEELRVKAKATNLIPNLGNVGFFHGDLESIESLGATTILYAYDRYFSGETLRRMSTAVAQRWCSRIRVRAELAFWSSTPK